VSSGFLSFCQTQRFLKKSPKQKWLIPALYFRMLEHISFDNTYSSLQAYCR
jgi:hypothetical protein